MKILVTFESGASSMFIVDHAEVAEMISFWESIGATWEVI